MVLTKSVSGLTQGQTYKTRFRTQNAYGWSPYSDTAYLLAADVPNQPNAPVFDSSTATDLILDLDLTSNNMGDAITTYTLYINDGAGGNAYTAVASYSTGLAQHTLNDVTDSITAGAIYRLKFSATNSIGESELSDALYASMVAEPVAPTSLVKVDATSSETSITLSWDPVADSAGTGGVISGY